MDTLLQDLRYAVRTLAKSPGFTAIVILTLGLGVGANTVMYSIARALFWRQPPVAAPDRLVVISAHSQTTGQYFDWSYSDMTDFRTMAPIGDLFAYYPTALSLSRAGHTDRVWAEMVSPNYFEALGVRALLGQTFTAAQATSPGAAPVAVLSESAWRRRFNSDRSIIGSTLRLNGHDFVIAGVAPARFFGLYYVGFRPELWVPAVWYDQLVPSARGQLERRGATAFRLAGHLRPGIALPQVQAAAATVGARLAHDYPAIYQGVVPYVQSFADSRPEPGNNASSHLMVSVFLGGVGLVLLIACANVANLLLARASKRQRELAIRVAIGASRRRLVAQLLVEASLLAAAGGVLGIIISVWATDVLAATLRLPTDIPFAWDFHLDARVFLYALALTAATALLFGLVPTLQSVTTGIGQGLKMDAPVLRSVRRGTVRAALVVGQIAMSCLLLVAAGLAVRTLRAVRDVAPGFDIRGALTGSVAPTLLGYDRARSLALYRQLLEGAAAMPGVRSASAARFLPLDFSASGGGLFIEGRETTNQGGEVSYWSVVGPDYFTTVGTPLVAGRDFAAGDSSGAPRVAIASEAAAASFWPGVSALGRLVRLNAPDSPAVRIVGIARDVKVRQLTERPQPYLYLPLAQNFVPDLSLMVRTTGDPARAEVALRALVARLDPDLPLAGVRTLEQMVQGRALLLPRLSAQFAAAFAALAVVLAVIGLYGVMSYVVNQRVREIGIRMALGAGAASVVAMVLRGGMRLACFGLALGIVLALGATRLLSGMLYGVQSSDPTTYVLVLVLLATVAAAACLLPARRAARVDPMVALRAE